MRLRELGEKLQQRLVSPLPGDTAHSILRATPVGNRIPNFVHRDPPRPGGVLILLYEAEGQVLFPVIKRQEYNGAHSGQVSLPGGKSEQGEDSIQTALREAEEEIGIKRTDLQVLGTLSNFYVMPSNFIITPVIAIQETLPLFRPDPYEVAKILTGTIAGLIEEDAIKQSEIVVGGQFHMNAPHFSIGGEVVWGATAMMLNEFRVIVREAIL